jgi:hypothetical protein
LNRQELLQSIAEIIKDYRSGEIKQIDTAHVDRWVKQFPADSQLIILEETNHILKTHYFSRAKIKELIRVFFKDESICGKNVKDYIAGINFLSIQKHGGSQKDLLDIIDEVLVEDYSLTIGKCGNSDIYFYIDDCVFTGNKFRYDIEDWLKEKKIKSGSKLITFHIAYHKVGIDYAINHINNMVASKNIELICWRHYEIDNRKEMYANIATLWPFILLENDIIRIYSSEVEKRCDENGWNYNAFRGYNKLPKEILFSSGKNRNIVEDAFLNAGVKLILAASNPSRSVRPLGFEKLESLGFGTFFITFRNTANNCPLVLWYGDQENFDSSHPLGLWYPLLPRKTQSQTDFAWGDIYFKE